MGFRPQTAGALTQGYAFLIKSSRVFGAGESWGSGQMRLEGWVPAGLGWPRRFGLAAGRLQAGKWPAALLWKGASRYTCSRCGGFPKLPDVKGTSEEQVQSQPVPRDTAVMESPQGSLPGG